MNTVNTPGAWAKLRANTYLYGASAIIAALFLTLGGVLTAHTDALLYCSLLPLVLLSDFPHIKANCTGDTTKQQEEKQVWEVAAAPFQIVFRRAHQFYTSDHPHSLRELGSIGIDLTRTRTQGTSHQSGGRKTGAGGQKKPASGGSDEEGEGGEPPANLPLVWTVHDLARALSVSAKTLQNKPASALPPAIRIPGCKGPRYRLRDVMAWLDGFPAASRPPQPKRNIGRPRIASSAQIAAIRGKGV